MRHAFDPRDQLRRKFRSHGPPNRRSNEGQGRKGGAQNMTVEGEAAHRRVDLDGIEELAEATCRETD